MLAIAFWEVQRLTRELNDLQRQAIEKRTELSHYEKYAGMLGGSGNINLNNIAGLNCDILPRAVMFGQYSNQVSSMSAMQNLQQMQMMGMIPCNANPIAQYQINLSAYTQFKEQALKALKEQEVRILNEKEKEIELELNSIEQRIKEKQAMLESSKSLAQKAATESVPKFGLG